jgi:amidase
MFMAEVALSHVEHYPAKAEAYGPWMRDFLPTAMQLKATDVAQGYVARDRFRGRLARLFADVDLLITPGIGTLIPTVEQIDAMASGAKAFDPDILRFTSPFNVAGAPTLSFPGGFTATGLPIGLQLAGPALAEPELVRAGAAFQRATDFHTRHPDLD